MAVTLGNRPSSPLFQQAPQDASQSLQRAADGNPSIMGATTAQTRANASQARSQRFKTDTTAEVYLNFGLLRLSDNQFFSLPMGIAIDTMLPNERASSNENFAQMLAYGNAALEHLQEQGMALEPGESAYLAFSAIENDGQDMVWAVELKKRPNPAGVSEMADIKKKIASIPGIIKMNK